MDRFSVNLELSDVEITRLIALIVKSRKTDLWTDSLAGVLVKLQGAVEKLNLKG